MSAQGGGPSSLGDWGAVVAAAVKETRFRTVLTDATPVAWKGSASSRPGWSLTGLGFYESDSPESFANALGKALAEAGVRPENCLIVTRRDAMARIAAEQGVAVAFLAGLEQASASYALQLESGGLQLLAEQLSRYYEPKSIDTHAEIGANLSTLLANWREIDEAALGLGLVLGVFESSDISKAQSVMSSSNPTSLMLLDMISTLAEAGFIDLDEHGTVAKWRRRDSAV
ncbi:hypothetical protein GCM10009839_54060 [Catenulispora yoronensis]|uniref:Uncharacterized protein n=2 Tax=Catenulispora yoronensis TaxID=450799 RepID=A0ABP5GDP0_9ACTN